MRVVQLAAMGLLAAAATSTVSASAQTSSPFDGHWSVTLAYIRLPMVRPASPGGFLPRSGAACCAAYTVC